MLVKAYDAVCWFEALKKFPDTKVEMFNECGGSAQFTVDLNSAARKINVNANLTESKVLKDFNTAFENFPLSKIPREYAGNCTKFLWSPLEPLPQEMEAHVKQDVLKDSGIDYPFRAFSHCMMLNLRKINGDNAIESVMKERTHGQLDWKLTFHTRHNEYRALHKVDLYNFSQELSVLAQAFADKMASQCKMESSPEQDRQWQGKPCGETVSSVWIGLMDEIGTAAYAAAGAWYEQITNYPWKDGFKDDDIKNIDWPLFGKIKDFTQTVWGKSRMVGYGYAFNETCAELGLQSRFMVSWYWPTGNVLGVKGEFKANVKPPKLLQAVLNLVPALLGGLLG